MSYLEERIAKALTVEMGAEFMPSDCQELAAAVMAVFREPETRAAMIKQVRDAGLFASDCVAEDVLDAIFGPAEGAT